MLGVMKKVGSCNIDTELGKNQYFEGPRNYISGTLPETFAGGGRSKCVVICYDKEDSSSGSGYQEFYNYNQVEGGSKARRYYRTYNGSTQTWNDWQRIYDAGMLNDSYDLSPLASALGVPVQVSSSITDWNNCVSTGCYRGNSTISNSPVSSGSYMIVSVDAIGNLAMQTAFCYDGSAYRFFIRGLGTNGSWSTWREIQVS